MDEGSGVRMAIELLAREQCMDPNGCFNRPLNFAVSLDQKEPLTFPMTPLTQTNNLLNARVL